MTSPPNARDRARAWINRRVNPLVVALLVRGLGPPTYAVVETTGRRTGLRRLGRGRPGYQFDGIFLRSLAAGGDMLTVRIDLG